jgi:hypothetical protein
MPPDRRSGVLPSTTINFTPNSDSSNPLSLPLMDMMLSNVSGL